jgi:GNAT superfamily N-acetyltransferase
MTIANPTKEIFADLLDDLADLYDRSYDGPILKLYKEVRPPKVFLQFLYSIDPEGFFVAEDRGTILGFISVHREWQTNDRDTVTEIQELAVDPGARSRDVGDQLLKRGLEFARDKGLARVGTWVGERNLRLRQVLTQHGFRQKYGWGKWVRLERNIRPA